MSEYKIFNSDKKHRESEDELSAADEEYLPVDGMSTMGTGIASSSVPPPWSPLNLDENTASEADIGLSDFFFQLLDDVLPDKIEQEASGGDIDSILSPQEDLVQRYQDKRLLLREFHIQGRTSEEILWLTDMLKNGLPGHNNAGRAGLTSNDHNEAITILRDVVDIMRDEEIPAHEHDTLKKVIRVIQAVSNALAMSSSIIPAIDVWLTKEKDINIGGSPEGERPGSCDANNTLAERFQEAKDNIDTCQLAELVSALQNSAPGMPDAQRESTSAPGRTDNDNDVVLWARVEEARWAIETASRMVTNDTNTWKFGSQSMRDINVKISTLKDHLNKIEKYLDKRKTDITENWADWDRQRKTMGKAWMFSSLDYDALSDDAYSMAESLDMLQKNTPLSTDLGKAVKFIRQLFLTSMQVNFKTPTMLMWMMKLHKALDSAVETMTSAVLTLSEGRDEQQSTGSPDDSETDNNLSMLSLLTWPDADSAKTALDDTIKKIDECYHVIDKISTPCEEQLISFTECLKNVRADVEKHFRPKRKDFYAFIDQMPEMFEAITEQVPQHRLKKPVDILLELSQQVKMKGKETKDINPIEFGIVDKLIKKVTDIFIALNEAMQPVAGGTADINMGSTVKMLKTVNDAFGDAIHVYKQAIHPMPPRKRYTTEVLYHTIGPFQRRMKDCISEMIKESKEAERVSTSKSGIALTLLNFTHPVTQPIARKVSSLNRTRNSMSNTMSVKMSSRNSESIDVEDMREWHDMEAILMPRYNAMRDNLDAMMSGKDALKFKERYDSNGTTTGHRYDANAQQNLKSAKENVIETHGNIVGKSDALERPVHQGLIYGARYSIDGFIEKIQEQLSVFEQASDNYIQQLSDINATGMQEAINQASEARIAIDRIIHEHSPLNKLHRFTPKWKIAQHLGGLIAEWRTQYADLPDKEVQQIIKELIETHIRPDYDTDTDHSIHIMVQQAYEEAREGKVAPAPPTQESVLKNLSFRNYLAKAGGRGLQRRTVTSVMRVGSGELLSLTWVKLVISLMLKTVFLPFNIRSSLHRLSKTAQIGQAGFEKAEWKLLRDILQKYAFRMGKSLLPLLGKLAVEAALITYMLSRDDRKKNLAAGFRPAGIASNVGFNLPRVMRSFYVKYQKEKAEEEREKQLQKLRDESGKAEATSAAPPVTGEQPESAIVHRSENTQEDRINTRTKRAAGKNNFDLQHDTQWQENVNEPQLIRDDDSTLMDGSKTRGKRSLKPWQKDDLDKLRQIAANRKKAAVENNGKKTSSQYDSQPKETSGIVKENERPVVLQKEGKITVAGLRNLYEVGYPDEVNISPRINRIIQNEIDKSMGGTSASDHKITPETKIKVTVITSMTSSGVGIDVKQEKEYTLRELAVGKHLREHSSKSFNFKFPNENISSLFDRAQAGSAYPYKLTQKIESELDQDEARLKSPESTRARKEIIGRTLQFTLGISLNRKTKNQKYILLSINSLKENARRRK
ncbi:hypothetical protein SME10J_46850 [Serratia marcescens]|nr:hypothetical protein SME10J_46850 [Serratia marcescens]